MARPRLYRKWNVPENVVDIVKAVCADYDRRKRAIRASLLTAEVSEEYIRLNNAIDSSLDENIEEALREYILTDIQLNRGYESSPASPYYAKNTYYQRKRKVIHDIAKSLYLIV